MTEDPSLSSSQFQLIKEFEKKATVKSNGQFELKMRVIAGRYKGRQLQFGSDKQHRPTKDRVKESIFNMIQGSCENAVVWDAFAGTGSLGIEALSRGASHVMFTDINSKCVKMNTSWLEETQNYNIIKQSALQFLKDTELKFDIVFLDPPWNQLELLNKIITFIIDKS